MRTHTKFLLNLALVFLALVALPVRRTYAHEGGPQLMLDRYQAEPGETISLTGGNIGTDLVVQLRIHGSGLDLPLGEALCDGHGDFSAQVTLPVDIAPGIYDIRVIDPSIPGSPVVAAAAAIQVNRAGISPAAAAMLVGFLIAAGGAAIFFIKQTSARKLRGIQ